METEELPETEPLEEWTLRQLAHGLKAGVIRVEDLRENDEVRQRINRAIVEKDMEKHSDVYDRLAEV